MDQFTLYVPREDDPLRSTINPGSAIVGTPAVEWLNADTGFATPADDGKLVIDYEGARHGQTNMVTYADKALHAAGRHREHYPTVARMFVEADRLIAVGFFYLDYERVEIADATQQNELRKWLFPDDDVQAGFEKLATEFRGTSPRAR